jgi:hypothetical protein
MAKKTTSEEKTFKAELISQFATLSTSGFGLVAALSWNTVIQKFINDYINKFLPKGSGIISALAYAVIITLLAVLVTYQLSKMARRFGSK